MSKVRIRLMAQSEKACERLRKHLLKKHPQMILGKPKEGPPTKYKSTQKWFCYGDYEFGKIRRRRNQ
jgi:hypothetical protein